MTTFDNAGLPVIDMGDAAFWHDIHPPLRAAREAAPVALNTHAMAHILRHADVEWVLKDPRFRAADLLAMNGLSEGPVWAWWQKVMFSQDPPAHTRLRSLVSRSFTPRAVAAIRPAARARAEEILAPALAAGKLDAQGDLGHRLPLAVISDLLDLPEEERPAFGEWTTTLGTAFGSATDLEVRRKTEAALANIDAYLEIKIAERRRRPGVDLLSQLIEAEEGGDRLSPEEMVALVENLMFAGHDTTRAALASMLVIFADHPDQFAAVRSDPGLIPAAVDEVLRYEAITFSTSRLASESLDVGGVTIEEGQAVYLCLASACRDGRQYPDADRFDVRRSDVRSLTFGAGIHYCLGAALARAELEEALAFLAHNAAAVELPEGARRVPFNHIRGFEAPLAVTFGS